MAQYILKFVLKILFIQYCLDKIIRVTKKYDISCQPQIYYPNKYWWVTTVLMIGPAANNVSVGVLIFMSLLFALAYMDFKLQEVYNSLLICYMFTAIFIYWNVLYNYDINSAGAIILVFYFYLLGLIGIYALADAVVMAGIVLLAASSSEHYVIISILCFICIQIQILIVHCILSVFKYKKVSNCNIAVIPFAAISAYSVIWAGIIFDIFK